jgi:hypothetical protein
MKNKEARWKGNINASDEISDTNIRNCCCVARQTVTLQALITMATTHVITELQKYVQSLSHNCTKCLSRWPNAVALRYRTNTEIVCKCNTPYPASFHEYSAGVHCFRISSRITSVMISNTTYGRNLRKAILIVLRDLFESMLSKMEHRFRKGWNCNTHGKTDTSVTAAWRPFS